MKTKKELRNLNRLNQAVYKKWIYNNDINRENCGNYLQKISNSITDYNKELKIIKKEPKDIVYMIMLANWIKETVDAYIELVRYDILQGFQYEELKDENEYLKAIRSFVVAHPLSTNRHGKYKLDGGFICSDIVINDNCLFALLHERDVYTINTLGLQIGKSKYDYLLKVYSKDDNMKFFKYICCSIEDITVCISKYIEKLYSFAAYLAKLKKKDYQEDRVL